MSRRNRRLVLVGLMSGTAVAGSWVWAFRPLQPETFVDTLAAVDPGSSPETPSATALILPPEALAAQLYTQLHPPKAPDPPKPPPPPPPRVNVRLVAITSSAETKHAFLHLQDAGVWKQFHAGEEILPGIILDRIEEHAVVLKVGELELRKELPQ